jgi:uncharacterized membrane protein YedE/YeeE
MKKNLIALGCGILFGLGLSMSHMVNPEKVLAFLDIGGNWDPSLAFVMLGALSVTTLSFKYILKRPAPVFEPSFQITNNKSIDLSLILGAAIFGMGWGMSGYCPGPAIAGIGLQLTEALILVIAIFAGFLCHKWLPVKLP